MAPQHGQDSRWQTRVGWLILIWSASVGALGVVAYCMKLFMRAAGLGA